MPTSKRNMWARLIACYAAALQPERRAAAPEAAAAIDTFLDKLNACSSGQQAFTVELDDPAGNSYIESPDGDVHADHALTVSPLLYHCVSSPRAILYSTLLACKEGLCHGGISVYLLQPTGR